MPRKMARDKDRRGGQSPSAGHRNVSGGKDPTNNAMKEGNAHGCLFGQREPEKSRIKEKKGKNHAGRIYP